MGQIKMLVHPRYENAGGIGAGKKTNKHLSTQSESRCPDRGDGLVNGLVESQPLSLRKRGIL